MQYRNKIHYKLYNQRTKKNVQVASISNKVKEH